MIKDLANRYTEVYAILKCLNDEDKNKIPVNVWKELEVKKNNSYEYQYIPGDEQYLDNYTIAILAMIYNNYLRKKR